VLSLLLLVHAISTWKGCWREEWVWEEVRTGEPLCVGGCHELFLKDAASDIPVFPGKVGFGGCEDCHATQV